MSRAHCTSCHACFYCSAILSPRHEHDHFPIPVRAGGEATVPTCLNCHDLKDRVPLADWSSELVEQAVAEAGPMGKILLAKCAAVIANIEADKRAAA